MAECKEVDLHRRGEHFLSLAQDLWRDVGQRGAALKELEKENARLKRLLAERMLEVDALKELLGKKA
jgi:hypothetical protein